MLIKTYFNSHFKQKLFSKKIILPFLFLSNLLPAQQLVLSNYTLSLSKAPNYLIDSTVVKANGTVNQKINYTYDSQSRLILQDRRDTQVDESEINTFYYDVNDSIIRRTYASGASAAPSLTALIVATRNQAKQVEYDTISYSSGSQYTLNASSISSYNNAGHLIENQVSSYNGSWNLLNRRQYQRNSTGKATNTLLQGWVNNNWENGSQNISTYNSNDDLTDLVFQIWNTGSSSWKNSSRSRYAYSASHLDTLTTYSWNNNWVNLSRYTYSPAGAIDSVTIDTWSGSQWSGSKRYIRTWSQGKLTSLVEKKYLSDWQNAWKHEYVYDGNGNNTVTNLYAYINPPNPWLLLIVTNHYYSRSTVGIAEHSLNDTKTYPVPTSGMLYFDSTLPVKGGTVYTASGLEAIHFEGASVDLSSIVTGVYYVKLQLVDGNYRVVKAIRE